MADSQYDAERKNVLFTEVLRELQQLLLNLWMISKAEDSSTVGSGV